MKVIKFIINSIFLVIMLGVAGLFLVPYLPFDHGIELRIVESGSMEPAIMTGSMTMVLPAETYQVGDVIMFNSRNAEIPTTHRVVDSYQDAGQTWFVTKGDANEEADAKFVPMREVMGVVTFHVPRVGFVLDFARQPMGFIFLIVLPALLIVLSEIEKIWREVRRRRGPAQDDNDSQDDSPTGGELIASSSIAGGRTRAMMDIATPARYLKLPTLDLRGITPYKTATQRRASWLVRTTAVVGVFVFSVVVASSSFLGSTVSYFNDIESSIENHLRAIALDVSAVPDGQNYNFFGDQIDDDGAVVIFVSPENDSVDARFAVSATVTSSSTVFCDAIQADSGVLLPYSGPLSLLVGTDVIFNAPWEITFSLPDETGLGNGEVCFVDIVLTAWHFDEELDEGYFDTETIPLSFTYTAPAPLVQFSSFSLFAPNVTSSGTSTENAPQASSTITEVGTTTEREHPSVHEDARLERSNRLKRPERELRESTTESVEETTEESSVISDSRELEIKEDKDSEGGEVEASVEEDIEVQTEGLLDIEEPEIVEPEEEEVDAQGDGESGG